jgi:hypothetical protein
MSYRAPCSFFAASTGTRHPRPTPHHNAPSRQLTRFAL